MRFRVCAAQPRDGMRRPVALSGMELELRLAMPEPGCEDEEGSELFREAKYQDYLQCQPIQATMLEWQVTKGEQQAKELQDNIGDAIVHDEHVMQHVQDDECAG